MRATPLLDATLLSKVDYSLSQSTRGDGRLHLYARQSGRVRQEKQGGSASQAKLTFRGSSHDGGVGR
jgi:hypothetical protein